MMPVIAVISILVLGAFFIAMVIKNLYYVCEPNEVLVLSGRSRSRGDGSRIGYRIVKGGRAIRMPLIETVDRIDLTNMIIEVTVNHSYSRGGIPLSVQGVANVKIAGNEPLLSNALERFLGRQRNEIMQVARETLEGNLRGVLATLTPEQVNMDKEAFAMKLAEEAEYDLNKIGLELDTLKIQNVSDEVGYLDAIGRMRSAAILRNAQIAEAEAAASAAEVRWENYRKGELAKVEADIAIAHKRNEQRVADATTKREAMIAEELAEVQAATAQSIAEVRMQEARIDQVRLRLQADIIRPAEAAKQQAIANAKANAVKITENGRATANVLKDLAATYRGSGSAGRDVLLMQKLVPVLRQVSGTIGQLKVDRLTVIGQNGSGQSGTSGSLAGQLVGTNEQIKAATGIDVAGVFREHFGAGEQEPTSPAPTPARRAPQARPATPPANRPPLPQGSTKRF